MMIFLLFFSFHPNRIHLYTHETPTSSASYGTIHITHSMNAMLVLSLFFYSFILHVHIPFYIYMASAVLRAAPALLLLLLVFFLLLDCGVDIDSHSHWLYGCDFRFVARHFAFLNPNKISLWFRTIFIIFNVNTIKTTTGNMILSLPANRSTTKRTERKKVSWCVWLSQWRLCFRFNVCVRERVVACYWTH